MADLGYWDYVKAAFRWKVPVSGLGDIPLNKFLLAGFAILGLGHPGFWLLGAAFEVGYLYFAAGHERFQRLVRLGIHQGDKQVQVKKQVFMITALDRVSQERYRRLAGVCDQIFQSLQAMPSAIGQDELQSGGLAQLMGIFLKLLHSRWKIQEIVLQTNREGIERDVADLEAKAAKLPESSPVLRSLKGTLDIQKRRIENLSKAKENLAVMESELDRIEKQINLVKEEIAVTSDPSIMSMRLDGVMDSLQGTTKWMTENAELFGSVEDYSPSSIPPPLPGLQKEKQ